MGRIEKTMINPPIIRNHQHIVEAKANPCRMKININASGSATLFLVTLGINTGPHHGANAQYAVCF